MNKSPSRRGRPAPKDKSSKDTILSAALTAFAQNGFEGASIPKIAQMAHVAPPLIHYYFGSKEKLWRATVDHSLGQLCKDALAIQAATRALAPLDRLRALLQAYTQFAARYPDQFVMIMAESRSESDRFAWVQENYTTILLGIIMSNLREAQQAGTIKEMEVEKLSFMMVGSIHLFFTANAPSASHTDLDRIADRYIEMMFDIFLNGISAASEDR